MRISVSENVNVALDAVWTHRFRSLLTILGIVIGITTVVTVSSLLTGLRKGIVVFFEEFGPNNIFIARYSGDPNAPPSQKEIRRRAIPLEYAPLIRRTAVNVEDVGISGFLPSVVNRQPLIAKVPGYESDRVRIAGFSANFYTNIQPKELVLGRLFTQEEEDRAARVTAIGPSLAEALFPDGKPLGRAINIGGAEYTVIGVFAPAKGGFFGENQLDYQASIPLSTARQRFPQFENWLITAKAREGVRDQAYEEVQFLLRKWRRVPAAEKDDFALSTADQIIRGFDQVSRAALAVSIALSSLGLLVGGIGVMNIMLVSVTERTREIGIRKAIGARSRDIVFQFLTEAVTLTGAGGLLGIILSILVTLLVSALVPSLPSEVPPWAVAAGFLMSVSVGVFFGVWPAVKAAKLDPVEALRYE